MTRIFLFSLFICMSNFSRAEQNISARIAFGVGVLATMGASIAAAACSLASTIGYPLLFLGYLYVKQVETSSQTFCPC